jgi:F-type H+-transporting ATPase subunit gamma
MANIRQLDKRRKSIKNIRKITRTMELIATARFKKAMDRAAAATDYTNRITAIVRDLASGGTEVSHPLLQPRATVKKAAMLILTSNRGLCGGYNGNVLRSGLNRRSELESSIDAVTTDVSGKRGIAAMKFRNVKVDKTYTEFEDEPAFEDVSKIAEVFLNQYLTGEIDRLDVVYTRFVTVSKQIATIQTLLPLASLSDEPAAAEKSTTKIDYEFLPSAESILEEVVPASFKVRLFKCFLDAAVSEQIARMVAMKSATENAGDMIKQLSRTYNRARQSKITGEIMEIIGGVEALN